MILSPLQLLSQTVTINPKNNTITLDETKAIDVAKIIENESRLKAENARLLSIIQTLNNDIQNLADKNIAAAKEIQDQTNRISKLTDNIIQISDVQLKAEEKKNKPGKVYISFQYDFNNNLLNSGTFKASYIPGKFSYGFTINPFNGIMIYGAEIGVNLF